MTSLAAGLAEKSVAKQGAIPARVERAISEASLATGVSFSYLVNKAEAESGFRTEVRAKTSSATGLYQFIDRTWLDMVDRYGAKHGLAEEAAAITRQGDRFVVSDRETRQQILELRKNPELAARMAAEYAGENQRYLQKELGRELNDTDLYLAHFLGAGGAENFLSGLAKNPNAIAADFVPGAAKANRNVFYDRSGEARTLAQVYERFAGKFGGETSGPPAAETEIRTAATDIPPVPRRKAVVPSEGTPSFFTTMMLATLEAPVAAERALALYQERDVGQGSVWNLFG